MARDYKKIVTWQRAHNLAVEIYRITTSFPAEEKFALTSQLRRAAYSVPANIVAGMFNFTEEANIVEGSGRSSHKEYLHFLHIAIGSLKEVEYFLLLSRELGSLHESVYGRLTGFVDATFAPLHGLMKAVKNEV